MSSKVVRDKIKAYLASNWVATVIAGEENEVDNPPDTLDPWLVYGFSTFGEEAASIGAGCFREAGTIEFMIYVASGRSTDTGLTHAETLRDMFRDLNLGDGVRCFTAGPPDSFGATSDGNWFGFQVDAAYTYDYQI